MGHALDRRLGCWFPFAGRMAGVHGGEDECGALVEVQRVQSISAGSAPAGVVLNATGYIVAAHRSK